MPEDEVLAWIDWAVDNNIPAIRFTGGEATLHPSLEVFCNYAYLQKRWIILNTNAMADHDIYDRLVFNDLRVSIPSLDPEEVDKMTGRSNVLEKKLALVDRTLKSGKKHINMLTVLTPDLIGKLENFVKLMQIMPGLRWIPLRYEASPTNPRPLTRSQMQTLAEEMAGLMDRYPGHATGICIAAPFCSVKPITLGARVFHGRIVNCGPYVALNVNFKGRLDACFNVCELQEKTSLEQVKNSPKLYASCSLAALPEECRDCEYVQRCGGGCRKPAGLVEHNGKLVDYLAGFVNQ